VTAAIRRAGLDDLAAVMGIETASFPTDAWSESAMRETFVEGDAIVAERDGAVVGYAAVLAPQGSGIADVLTIAVEKAARGAGLGRALLGSLIDIARGSGAQRVFLEVRADNPVAQGLYASVGFGVVGRRPRYYQPDGVDAIVMRLDLPAGAEATS
jgi:ribosomal-protein-alanine acetyltransferase